MENKEKNLIALQMKNITMLKGVGERTNLSNFGKRYFASDTIRLKTHT